MKHSRLFSLLQTLCFVEATTSTRSGQREPETTLSSSPFSNQQELAVKKRRLRGNINIFDHDDTTTTTFDLKIPEYNTAQTRVIGGSTAISIRFPYYTLLFGSTGQCGASLIAPDLVLTAAHCNGQHRAHVGRNNLFSESDYYESFSIQEEYIHPQYSPDTSNQAFDKKIIKLSGVSTLQPIEVQSNFTTVPENTKLTVLGFGITDNEGDQPSQLQQASQWIVPEEECEATIHQNFTFNGMISDDMFCASGGDKGAGVCSGDSGGPLIQTRGTANRDKLVGIVSWFLEPCAPEVPSVFQKTSADYEWIRDTVCTLSEAPPLSFGCPTEAPSSMPSTAPSTSPSSSPSTSFPSSLPSDSPSAMPSIPPTGIPSHMPTAEHSSFPSDMPSLAPSVTASDMPSSLPSSIPSDTPSFLPSSLPSDMPSQIPSDSPSLAPSTVPSSQPTILESEDDPSGDGTNLVPLTGGAQQQPAILDPPESFVPTAAPVFPYVASSYAQIPSASSTRNHSYYRWSIGLVLSLTLYSKL